MRFKILTDKQTLQSAMRRVRYAPSPSAGDELAFVRRIRGEYPRFHVYCRQEDRAAVCTMHLDQKRPSYQGTSAHAGEYDGPLVAKEVERITSALRP